MAPYATSILPALLELLEAYSKQEYTDSVLWSDMIAFFDDSFTVEDGEGA